MHGMKKDGMSGSAAICPDSNNEECKAKSVVYSPLRKTFLITVTS